MTIQAFQLEPLDRRLLLAAVGLDATFAQHGRAIYQRPYVFSYASSPALTKNDKVIALFNYQRGGGQMARFTLDGKLDKTFGNQGTVVYSYRHFGYNKRVLIQPDGRILRLYTDYIEGRPTLIHLQRFVPDGKLDKTFGQHGLLTVKLPQTRHAFLSSDMVLLPNGRIVVARADKYNTSLYVRRYKPTGKPDPTFGPNGILRIPIPAEVASKGLSLSRMLFDPAGRIILIGDNLHYEPHGLSQREIATQAFVVRLTPNGALDPTFSHDGIAFTPIGTDAQTSGGVTSGDLQGSNILVAASSGHTPVLFRFTTCGELDASFGDSGRATPLGSPDIDGEQFDIAVQKDGHIVFAVGKFTDAYRVNDDILVGRFAPDGSLQASPARIHIGTDPSLASIVLQPAGKFIVFGRTDAGSTSDAGTNLFALRFTIGEG